MKLRVEQLGQHLQQSLLPVYLLSGDEPLQMMEAVDSILLKAKENGYLERDILTFDTHADWSLLSSAAVEQSLFAQKTIVDVRLNAKAGNKGSLAIREYMAHLPSDKILIIQTKRLDKSAMKSVWVKAIDKQGVVIQIWDLSAPQTLAWVAKRMRHSGLQPTQEAIRLLTERIEGNLLAADQEIRKLSLLFNQQRVDVEEVLQVVADSSRFSVFDLSGAVLAADVRRIQHILTILREEGTALPLILWSLSTLSRQLYDACFKVSTGQPPMQAMGYMAYDKKAAFQAAMRRLQNADWSAILAKNFLIDRMSKGHESVRVKDESRVWDEIVDFSLLLAGKNV